MLIEILVGDNGIDFLKINNCLVVEEFRVSRDRKVYGKAVDVSERGVAIEKSTH